MSEFVLAGKVAVGIVIGVGVGAKEDAAEEQAELIIKQKINVAKILCF